MNTDGDATSGEGKSGVKRESGDVTEAITSMAKKIKAYKKLGDGDAKAAAKQTLEATLRKFFMFKKLKTSPCNQIVLKSQSKGLSQRDYVCIDTDASSSITGFKEDTVWLCPGTQECMSTTFVGINENVGAGIKPQAECPMLVHATAFRNTDDAAAQEGGEKIAIIDPESFYVPKIGTRILSAIKLAKKGISLQMNGLGIGQHILLVQGTGQIIPLEIVDDILVMKILHIDARKVKVTKEMTKLLTVPKRDMFNSVVSSNKLQFLTTDLNQMRAEYLASVPPKSGENDKLDSASGREDPGTEDAGEAKTGQTSAAEALTMGKFGVRPGWKAKERDGAVQRRGHGLNNTWNLNRSQKNWLYHHRLACRNIKDLVTMSSGKVYEGMDVKGKLDADCYCCKHASQVMKPFPRVAASLRAPIEGYETIDVDGVSGFRCRTVNGCTGAFVFFARGSERRWAKLYQKKSDMPRICTEVLNMIEQRGFLVFRMKCDNAGENISDEMLEWAIRNNIVMSFGSPDQPEEDSYAERSVGILCNMARAMMYLVRDKLPKSAWGLALIYAGEVDAVCMTRNGRSAIENETGRAPNDQTHPRPVFGCDVMVIMNDRERNGKLESRSIEAVFVGVEYTSYLLKSKKTNELFKRSRRACTTMEMEYTKPTSRQPDVPGLDEIPPTARPSVTSHRHVASSEEEKNIGDEVNGENAFKEYVNKGPEPMVDSDEDMPDLDSAVSSESGEDDAQNIDMKSNMESNLPTAACTEVNKDGELKLQDGDELENANEDEDAPRQERQEESKDAEDESEDEEEPGIEIPYATCIVVKDNETPTSIAIKFDVDKEQVIANNSYDVFLKNSKVSKLKYPSLNTKYKKGREVWVPAFRCPKGRREIVQMYKVQIDERGSGGTTPEEKEEKNSRLLKYAAHRSEYKKREVQEARAKAVNQDFDDTPWEKMTPRQRRSLGDIPASSVYEALLLPDWKHKLDSCKKELQSFKEKEVYKEIRYEERDRSATILSWVEIFTIKFDTKGEYLKHKFRLAIGGHMSVQGKDDDKKHSPQLASEEVRLFAAIAAESGEEPYSADVSTAYLNAKNEVVIYAYEPTFMPILRMSDDQVLALREQPKQMTRKEIRRLSVQDKTCPGWIWLLLQCVYGQMDAGMHWNNLLNAFATEEAGATPSRISPCMYYREVPWDYQGFLMINYTDDCTWNGSVRTKEWFLDLLLKKWDCKYERNWKHFLGMGVDCNPSAGYVELTQEGFIEKMVEKFEAYMPDCYRERSPPIPMKEKQQMDDIVSDEEWEKSKHSPYPSVVCAMNYATTMTKLECVCAQSMLGGKLQRWSRADFVSAIYFLWYLWGTRKRGLIYWKGKDPHGSNIAWSVADTDLGSDASKKIRASSIVMCNAGAVLAKSKKRGHHVATALAEMEGSFYSAMDLIGFTNVLQDIGHPQCENMLYTDNYANYSIIENRMSLGSKNKHIDLRYLKLKDWVKMRKIKIGTVPSEEMMADLGTKNLGPKQFCLLRDWMSGYIHVATFMAEVEKLEE